MPKITIHGFAPSTYTRSARMAAIELGVEHDLVPIAYGKPEHLVLHPFGKMPVMTSGETTIFETLAVMSWLDEASANPGLFGADRKVRADVFTMVSVATDYAYRPVVHVAVKEGEPDSSQMAEADRVLDWLETSPRTGDFLASDKVTAADLFFAPMIAYHAKQVGEDRAYRSRPGLRQWMGRMAARRSFRETM